MGNDSNSIVSIDVEGWVSYPRFYRLYDHDNLLTVIKVNNRAELNDVEFMLNMAKSSCTHTDKAGDCGRIEETDEKEWYLVHIEGRSK